MAKLPFLVGHRNRHRTTMVVLRSGASPVRGPWVLRGVVTERQADRRQTAPATDRRGRTTPSGNLLELA